MESAVKWLPLQKTAEQKKSRHATEGVNEQTILLAQSFSIQIMYFIM